MEAGIIPEVEPLIGIEEVADRLVKVLGYRPHNHTLHKAVDAGMPCVPDRLRGRGYRFQFSKVVAWLLEPAAAAQASPTPVRRGPGRPRKHHSQPQARF